MTPSLPCHRASTRRVFAYALLFSAVLLFFCSKSSFGYPINDWSDANIYFSVGKGMLRGEVVYRDLYDHKGPLLYALHALCAAVSPLSFTGVYILEVLCAAWFLTLAYKLLALYGAGRAAFLALPFTALFIYTSLSFQQGDSAEELCLPLLAFSLYDLLRHLKTEYPRRMTTGRLLLNGFLLGCVCWVKFTMAGLHAGVAVVLFLSQASRKNWKQAFACVGWLALGFALSTAPWLIYFGLNGAILPWLKTYLYDNLFLYSQGGEAAGLLARCKEIVKSALSWLGGNPGYTVLIALGVAWGGFRKRAARWERPAVLIPAGLGALGVFIGGKSYPYYGLVLASLAPLGLLPLCLWLERLLLRARSARRRLPSILAAFACAGSLALCPVLSPNVKASFGQPRAETMQYRFAAVLARYDSPTLLNYGFMDAGFYTAAGLVPPVKYFHQTNVPLQEMLDEQARYVRDGVCDFVVTRGKEPPGLRERYELVATADTPEGFWYERVYLFRRKAPEPRLIESGP